MEDQSGRHKDTQGTTDPAPEILRSGTGVEAHTRDHTQAIWQRHTRIHGRTEQEHGGTVPQQPRTGGTMAQHPIHGNGGSQ
jgi:hypothetical protein